MHDIDLEALDTKLLAGRDAAVKTLRELAARIDQLERTDLGEQLPLILPPLNQLRTWAATRARRGSHDV